MFDANLIVLPVLLPLIAAAVMLWLGERRRRRVSAWLNVAVCAVNLAVALLLLAWVDGGAGASGAGTGGSTAALVVYLPGNWPVPVGITLVVDRLSAALVLLTATVALASVLFAVARWQRAGVHFHPLWQIQLMGLNGVFLTGDLFNLFVFFEVLLAASYGLALHGSGRARVAAGLHYVVVNLIAAFLFLLGIALLYRVTGTLGLAELASRIGVLPADRLPLLQMGAALLAVAFLTKAACWPLNFWMVPVYAAASPPVAGLFVLLSKVGVYAVLRLHTLWFPATAADTVPFGGTLLVWVGLATLAFGTLGTLAAQTITRLASFSLVVSSGTLIAAIGFAKNGMTAAALFYLFVSTLAASALFLLSELVDRSRLIAGADAYDAAGRAPVPLTALDPPGVAPIDSALDREAYAETAGSPDELPAPVGRPIRAGLAFLGFAFMACAVLIAGLPPLAGFLSKFNLIAATLANAGGQLQPGAAADAVQIGAAGWTFIALLLLSGAAGLLALSRIGIRAFWAPQQRPAPHLRVIEVTPVAGLLVICVGIGLWPDPVLRYLNAAAAMLHQPAQYVRAVGSAVPKPAPSAIGR